MPTCLASSKLGKSPEECSEDSACNSDPVTFAENIYDTNGWSSLNPIGIAKDGHIIWGPFDADGDLWGDCDVDVCNGIQVDGYYGYAATGFHPYIVGCWGPGNYPADMT